PVDLTIFCAINKSTHEQFVLSRVDANSRSAQEFVRIYSMSETLQDTSQFGRYTTWLKKRNNLIKGFTKNPDNDFYYLVAEKPFYDFYSRFGFCSRCGILRCSPVWCICRHKELSTAWTSGNRQLDEFIKETQLQTRSA